MTDPYRSLAGGPGGSRPFGYTPDDLLNPLTARSLARPVSYVQTYAPPPVGNGGVGTLPGLNSYDSIGKTAGTLQGTPSSVAQPGELSLVQQEGTDIYAPPPANVPGGLESMLKFISKEMGGFMPADIHAHVDNFLGLAANLLDIPLEFFGNLPEIPLPQLLGPTAAQGNYFPNRQQFFEALPETEAKREAMDRIKDDPMNALFYMSQYFQFNETEIAHGLGGTPLMSDYFVPSNNFGDQVMRTLGMTGFFSRMQSEAFARTEQRDIEGAILTADINSLNPELQRIRTDYEEGRLTREELPSVITRAGFGMSNDIWHNLVWEMITDPLIVASLGTGVGLKLATSSGRLAMINNAVKLARDGLSAARVGEMDAWAVGRIVDGYLEKGEVISTSDAQKLTRNTSRFEWLKDNEPTFPQQALEGMTPQGKIINALDPLIQGAARVSRALNSPFDMWGQITNRGFKNGERIAAYSSTASVEGMFQAYGLHRIQGMQKLFDTLGLPDQLKEVFGRMAANLEVAVGKDALSRLATEAKGVPYASPDAILRAQSETYHSRLALQIEGYMRRVMTQFLPTSRFGKEASEEVMAKQRQVARMQLQDLAGSQADMAAIDRFIENADNEMLALVEHMRYGRVLKTFDSARGLARSSLGDAALALKKKLQTGGRGGGPMTGTKTVPKTEKAIKALETEQELWSRATMVGPKHLTDSDAEDLIKKIRSGDVEYAREAVERFEVLFSNFAAKGLDDEEFMRSLDTFVKDLKDSGGLTRVIKDKAELPRELRDWLEAEENFAKRAGVKDQYRVGIAPEYDQRWREVRTKEGEMIGVNAWADAVPDVASTPEKNIHSLSVVRDRLFRPIRGERHLEESRRSFRVRAVNDYGLSRSQANQLFGAIRRKAGQANTMPRGLTNSELNDLLSEMKFDEPTTQRLGTRGMARLVANAFEGDTFTVGITQKISGRAKSLGARGPGNNWLGVVSERLYPMARFTYNPIFMLQEAAEPFFWNILRGVTPGMRWTKEDLMSFEALRRAGFLGEWADQWEFSPSALMILGAKEAHRVAGPGTAIGKAAENLLGEGRKVKSLAELKRLNYLRQNSRSFGLSFKKFIEDLHPALWDEWATMVGSTDPTRIGNWWWVNKALNLPDDPNVQHFLADASLPPHMGESARQTPLALAKHHKFTTFAELRKSVRSGGYTEDQFRMAMKDIADPVYIDRAYAMTSHMGAAKWWQMSADEYAMALGNSNVAKQQAKSVMREMRTIHKEFARVLNFTEDEYLSRFMSRPMTHLDSNSKVPLGSHYQLVGGPNLKKFYNIELLPHTDPKAKRMSSEARAIAGTPSRKQFDLMLEAEKQAGIVTTQPGTSPWREQSPVIEMDNPAVPDTLFHATIDLPAVQQSGYLRPSEGAGGFGANMGSGPYVSLTVRREVAEAFAEDLRMIAHADKMTPEELLNALTLRVQKDVQKLRDVPGADWDDTADILRDWNNEIVPMIKRQMESGDDRLHAGSSLEDIREFKWDMLGEYGEWASEYFDRPASQGRENIIGKLDPDKIGVIEVPKSSLAGKRLEDVSDIGGEEWPDARRGTIGGFWEVRSFGYLPLHSAGPSGGPARISGTGLNAAREGWAQQVSHAVIPEPKADVPPWQNTPVRVGKNATPRYTLDEMPDGGTPVGSLWNGSPAQQNYLTRVPQSGRRSFWNTPMGYQNALIKDLEREGKWFGTTMPDGTVRVSRSFFTLWKDATREAGGRSGKPANDIFMFDRVAAEADDAAGPSTHITSGAIDGTADGDGSVTKHIMGEGLNVDTFTEMAESGLHVDKVNDIVEAERSYTSVIHAIVEKMPDDVKWRNLRDYVAFPEGLHENRMRVEMKRAQTILGHQGDLAYARTAREANYILEDMMPGSGQDYFDMNKAAMRMYKSGVDKGPPNSGVHIVERPDYRGMVGHYYGWYDENGDLVATAHIITDIQSIERSVRVPTTPGGPVGQIDPNRMYLEDLYGPSIRSPTGPPPRAMSQIIQNNFVRDAQLARQARAPLLEQLYLNRTEGARDVVLEMDIDAERGAFDPADWSDIIANPEPGVVYQTGQLTQDEINELALGVQAIHAQHPVPTAPSAPVTHQVYTPPVSTQVSDADRQVMEHIRNNNDDRDEVFDELFDRISGTIPDDEFRAAEDLLDEIDATFADGSFNVNDWQDPGVRANYPGVSDDIYRQVLNTVINGYNVVPHPVPAISRRTFLERFAQSNAGAGLPGPPSSLPTIRQPPTSALGPIEQVRQARERVLAIEIENHRNVDEAADIVDAMADEMDDNGAINEGYWRNVVQRAPNDYGDMTQDEIDDLIAVVQDAYRQHPPPVAGAPTAAPPARIEDLMEQLRQQAAAAQPRGPALTTGPELEDWARAVRETAAERAVLLEGLWNGSANVAEARSAVFAMINDAVRYAVNGEPLQTTVNAGQSVWRNLTPNEIDDLWAGVKQAFEDVPYPIRPRGQPVNLPQPGMPPTPPGLPSTEPFIGPPAPPPIGPPTPRDQLRTTLPQTQVPEVALVGTRSDRHGRGYYQKMAEYVDSEGVHKYYDATGRGSYDPPGSAAAQSLTRRMDKESMAVEGGANEILTSRILAGLSYLAWKEGMDGHELIRVAQSVLEGVAGKHARSVKAAHISIEQILDFARVGGDEIVPSPFQRAHLESMLHPDHRSVDTINPSMEDARAYGHVDEQALRDVNRMLRSGGAGPEPGFSPESRWWSRDKSEQSLLSRGELDGLTPEEAAAKVDKHYQDTMALPGRHEMTKEVTPAKFKKMEHDFRVMAAQLNARQWAGRTDWTARDVQAVNTARYRMAANRYGPQDGAEGLMNQQYVAMNFELEPHPGTDFAETVPDTQWVKDNFAQRDPDALIRWFEGQAKAQGDIARMWAAQLGEISGVSVVQASIGPGRHIVNWQRQLDVAPYTFEEAARQVRREVGREQADEMMASGEWDEYVREYMEYNSVEDDSYQALGPQVSMILMGSPEAIETAVALTGSAFQKREVYASVVNFAEAGKTRAPNWSQDWVTDFVIPAGDTSINEASIIGMIDKLWGADDLVRQSVVRPNGDRSIRVYHEVGLVNERGLEALKPLRGGPGTDAVTVAEIESMGITIERGVVDMFRQQVDITPDRRGIIDFYNEHGSFVDTHGKTIKKENLDDEAWDTELNWHVGHLTDPWYRKLDQYGADHAVTALRNRTRGEALAYTNIAYWKHLGEFVEEFRARGVNLPAPVRGYHMQLGPKGVRAATKIDTDLKASIYLMDKVGPDSIPHEILHSIVPHFEDSMHEAVRDAYSAATGFRRRRAPGGGLSDKQEEWLAEEFVKYVTTGTVRTPALQSAFNMMGKMVKEHKGVKKLSEAHPDATALFDKLFGQENHMLSRVPFDPDQARILGMARYLMSQSEEQAHTSHYFKRGRNFLERSVNHPYLGYYPASYMWGKVVPELVRFLVREPFGIQAPLAGYAMASHVSQAIMLELNTDPESRKWVEDHPQLIRFLQMMLPGTPWDIPVNAPAWARHTVAGVAQNQIRQEAGQPPKDVGLLQNLEDTTSYAFGVTRFLGTIGDISKELGPQAAEAPQASGLNQAQQYLEAYGIGAPAASTELDEASNIINSPPLR